VSGAVAVILLLTDLGKDSPSATSARWRTHPVALIW